MSETKAVSAAPKMVNLTIDGKSVQVAEGTTVFQAAAKAGIFIPHYCYHDDLSIAGVCRMCMVDVEKTPKLQISCNTMATEGMVVRTDTEKVKDTVKGVLELHLINHPLDCPICDKAGECKLQDFYRDYGLYKSRMDFDEKVHKPKVVDIGTIVLDSERCILCSRCVRFTSEVTKTNELGIFNRGDRAELRTYDNGPLKNEYTGNLADICPVGALTAKDFRFQCRVWFLEKASTTCAQCARGCNTTVSVNPKTQKLYRVEPRRNPDVNKSWICDEGRWDYHYVYDESRITVPFQRIHGQLHEQSWHVLFADLGKELEANAAGFLVGLSTSLTNEEIVDVVQSLSAKGVKQFTWIVDEKVVGERTPYDNVLRHRDTNSNSLGFEKVMTLLGVKWLKQAEATALMTSGKVSRFLGLGLENKEMPGLATLLTGAKCKVALHATSLHPVFEVADNILPNVSSFEKSGTLVNALGRWQKLNASLSPQFTARDAHATVLGICNGSDRVNVSPKRAQEIFEAWVAPKFGGGEKVSWKKFNPMGIELGRN